MKTLDIEAARVVALRFLGYSARSRSEIEQRLKRDEFSAGIIVQVIGELEAAGYLDDRDFARHWIEDRADRKRYGRVRLAAELNRKGVDSDVAKEALDAIDDDAELLRAIRAAEGRWNGEKLAALDPASLQSEKQRISGFLLRRGFSWQTIKKVLSALMENSS